MVPKSLGSRPGTELLLKGNLTRGESMETVTVSKFLADNNITGSARYICEDTDPFHGTTQHHHMDKWSVSFHFGKNVMTLDYWTGLGHRRIRDTKTGKQVRYQEPWGGVKTLHDAEIQASAKPFPPEIADVMDCIISDAQGFENSPHFEDWASEYGYDTDSRTAEKTFNAVSHQTNRLKKFLGYSLYQVALTTERL